MPLTLRSSIEELKFVGSKSAEKLRRLGIERIIDLLFTFPTHYEDRTTIVSVETALGALDETVNVTGRVISLKQFRNRFRRLHITTVELEDDTGTLPCVWFRQPFIANSIHEGDTLCVTGKVRLTRQGVQMQPTGFEKMTSATNIHSGRIVPVYAETRGMTSKYLRRLVHSVLPLVRDVPESLPKAMIEEHHLPSLHWALRSMHFPASMEDAERARRRFAFEELLLVQLHSQMTRSTWRDLPAQPFAGFSGGVQTFIHGLPFTLTSAQERAWKEIADDLAKRHPMNRLLEGDVGSGKTIIAIATLLAAVEAKAQGVLLAPTDILARQHFETITRFLNDRAVVGLMSGKTRLVNRDAFGNVPSDQAQWATPTRNEMLALIRSGELPIIVGTHALLESSVAYRNLALVIIDEQHRFGVEQRDALLHRGKGQLTPHLLTMSATPIPRTLSLALFGDLDLSILDELPPGRKTIITKVVDPRNREKAYTFIRERLHKGRQMFVVTPLVEESELLRAKAATAESKRLAGDVFPEYVVACIHGRMKSDEKEKIMKRFRDGAIDVLVSTSIIEVGVDIPNATIMLIEGAERFGLAQLHQFRGRVGRGSHQSFCFLFQSQESAQSTKRLQALSESADGFALAEFDLRFRGAGNVFGTEQSGIVSQLKVADIRDAALVRECHDTAKRILRDDPDLSSESILAKRLKRFRERVHFE